MYDNPSGIQPRKHLRLIITLPLKFFVDKEAVARDGMVIDVGAGGMHFESRHRFADSSALRLVFGLRPGRQFELQARVNSVWVDLESDKVRYRVAFVTIAKHIQDEIAEFVFNSWRETLLNNDQ
jgi:hypothetical protein